MNRETTFYMAPLIPNKLTMDSRSSIGPCPNHPGEARHDGTRKSVVPTQSPHGEAPMRTVHTYQNAEAMLPVVTSDARENNGMPIIGLDVKQTTHVPDQTARALKIELLWWQAPPNQPLAWDARLHHQKISLEERRLVQPGEIAIDRNKGRMRRIGHRRKKGRRAPLR